jgi:hypothetical protein
VELGGDWRYLELGKDRWGLVGVSGSRWSLLGVGEAKAI